MPKRKSVYFNKSSGGKGKYRTGEYYSIKNKAGFIYRSAYEYAFFEKLEAHQDVVQFISEPFFIPYRDSKGKSRSYKPDLIILYKDGSIDIVEIKPKTMLANPDVQCKAAGCRAFIKIQKMKATYKFVTEEDIFINNQEYLDLLARI